MKKQNFSLIELISVVAIFAILLSLLQPALLNTLKKSEVVTCKNNLKQLGLTTFTYVDDHNGRLPPRSFGSVGTWLLKLHETATGETITDKRKFNPFSTMFECPTAQKENTEAWRYLEGGYGYNHNAGDFAVLQRRPLIWEDQTKLLSDIQKPHETVLIGDDKDAELNKRTSYFNTQLLPYTYVRNRDGNRRIRHDLFANYFWADGHTEEVLWDQFIHDGLNKGSVDYYLNFDK